MYHDLPLCRPGTLQHKPESLGEVVDGNRLINTSYDIHFRQDVQQLRLCTLQLKQEDLAKLRNVWVGAGSRNGHGGDGGVGLVFYCVVVMGL